MEKTLGFKLGKPANRDPPWSYPKVVQNRCFEARSGINFSAAGNLENPYRRSSSSTLAECFRLVSKSSSGGPIATPPSSCPRVVQNQCFGPLFGINFSTAGNQENAYRRSSSSTLPGCSRLYFAYFTHTYAKYALSIAKCCLFPAHVCKVCSFNSLNSHISHTCAKTLEFKLGKPANRDPPLELAKRSPKSMLRGTFWHQFLRSRKS